MRYQERAIRMTKTAVENFYRNAKGTELEKLAWKPENRRRSVLEQAQEVAQMPR